MIELAIAPWQHDFRLAFLPQLPTEGLRLLEAALAGGSTELIHNATVAPLPSVGFDDEPTGADLIAYVFWKAENLPTVAAVADGWNRAMFDADMVLGYPGACHRVLGHWDGDENARADFLSEVRLWLAEREKETHRVAS